MKKYSIIYADPPWRYKVYSKKGLGRSAESHYPTMELEDIRALPVGTLAADDCVLFLWTTIPLLHDCFSVMRAWGFSYKTVAFVWIKQNRKSDSLFWGMGHWTRANAEFCMLATKGHPKRRSAGVHQVILSHIEEHSKKPEEARRRIVELMGDLPRIELFARQKTDGWDAWGNEVVCDVALTGGEINSPEFGSIRTLEQNGKVLFCGTDVATALGYTNPRKAVRDHTRGGTKCSIGVQTGKKADGSPAVQMVEMLFIPEGDLYRLIAHSKLPSAERFEQWVFDEVLPAIRKHGAYLTKEKLWEIATSPEALIKLCSELLAEREENASLREENALLESKAAFYDLFIDLNHSTNLRTTAKELLVPERRFVRFLLEKRFVYRTASGNVLPYAKPANEGLFCVKDYCNHGHIGSYTLITPQGKLYFAQLRDMILMVV